MIKSRRVTSVHLGVALAGALLVTACVQPLKLARDDSPKVLSQQLLDVPSPAEPGPYRVRSLYYGSGTDKRRPEYRDSVTLKTRTVDGSKLAAAPNASLGKSRKRYWGFGFDSMPVNGRVWYPEGDGPFPLVLIVHGNHDMKDYSDPGYRYLGEHLASRGYLFVSVDENFLNGNIRAENDARGWMLLKHLEAWRGFNDSTGSPFQGRVDLDHIALMGHSRGGEAVAVAGAFNRLTHYPDDATVTFNFGFGIKSLVAIAPIDGQYEPTGRPTPLTDVNYLVIHGSHDGDVSAFSGLRQYQRVRFTDGGAWFKAAIWMYRANHGQWNTEWGDQDWGSRSARYLDLRGLIGPEEQRQFAKVYLTAFLDATLEGKKEYLPLFRDHRAIGAWLPKTMYLTRFQDAGFRVLADFGEDVDVRTGSVAGVTIAGDSLATWREAVVPLRWKDSKVGHNAVWLGWNNRIAGDDTSKMGRPASYSVTLSDSLRATWGVGEGSVLELSLAPTNDKPAPRTSKDTTKAGDTAAVKAPSKEKPKSKAPKPPATDTIPMDLTVEAVDMDSVVARVPLSRYGAIRRPLDISVLRRRGRDRRNFATQYELVLQTYVIPLADFEREEPRFTASKLRAIRLVFDRTAAGTVVLSDVGLSTMDPAFLVTAAGPRP